MFILLNFSICYSGIYLNSHHLQLSYTSIFINFIITYFNNLIYCYSYVCMANNQIILISFCFKFIFGQVFTCILWVFYPAKIISMNGPAFYCISEVNINKVILSLEVCFSCTRSKQTDLDRFYRKLKLPTIKQFGIIYILY